MVHQSEPDQDPARRHDIVHGCRPEERLEGHGEHLPEGVLGYRGRAEVDCYG